ncbi:alcohol dehydrogenase [Flagelloscypha sp. PMI_526]|nr:alcohol dehydrogenase [Flagelloscypha sp. PMI_526]
MSPILNGRIAFHARPKGLPVPGETASYDTSATIDIDSVPLNGGFLVKNLFVSMDPWMQRKIDGDGDAYTAGKTISNYGVGLVLRSELQGFSAGDHVYGENIELAHYTIFDAQSGLVVVRNPAELPWSVFVGQAGMAGQTGYFGWKEYANAKPGETVFISGGAGPVGQTVIQLAKLDGLKVISSAGSDEKVARLKELGADVAFNYKTTSTREVLKKEGPLNIYWDNVGGETLEAALDSATRFARFIECGMVSGYVPGTGHPIPNLWNLVTKSIKMTGFTLDILAHKYQDEFYETVPAKLKSGEMKYSEEVTVGLENAMDVLLGVLKGKNKAKAVMQIHAD